MKLAILNKILFFLFIPIILNIPEITIRKKVKIMLIEKLTKES
jgi:hypothetical protein